MRVLLALLIVLIVAVVLVMGFQHGSGYVIIHLSKTQLEVSFWTAAVSLLIAFIVLYIVVRLLSKLFGLGAYFKKKKKLRRAQNAKQLSNSGMIDIINGRWSSARNNLEKAAGLTRHNFLPKLYLAISSHLEGDTVKRDLTLSTIDTKNKEEHVSLQLAKAQFLMNHQDWEKALACLKGLRQQIPASPYLTLLLAKTCSHLHEWPLLTQLLPNLRKNKTVQESLYNEWQEKCFKHQLRIGARQSTDMLIDTWKHGSRDERAYLSARQTYIQGLLDLNEFEKATTALATLLKKQWEPKLCASYQQFPDSQADELIHTVDKLCQQHPSDANCKKTLGILCYKAKRYVRAKEILAAVVSEHPCPDSLQALAKAHAAEGEWEKAADCFKRAI